MRQQGLVVSWVALEQYASHGEIQPKALINRAEIKVDLDLVVLKGDQRKGKSGVAAIPELEGARKEWSQEERYGERTPGLGASGCARSVNVSEDRISDEGKLGGVDQSSCSNQLLAPSKGKLVPDVHPVTILTVNALTTNLDLNLRDELLAREI